MTRPILVVGRRGQLASDLAALSSAARPILALGRPELDLTVPASLAAVFDRVEPAAVINAAAYTAVDRAESEPERAFALNADGPAALAGLCAASKLPLVHVSTDQVFDGRKAGGYTEEDPPNPLCTYGRSKHAGEEAVLSAHPASLVVRVSWVFGPSADNFVKKLLGWAAERERLTIVADQIGRPTYSPALADALVELAGRMAEGGEDAPRGLLHLAGASVMSRYEQALAVMRASAARGGPVATIEPVATRDFPTPATRPLNAELDCARAAGRFGIRLGPFEPDLAATLDRLLGPPR